MKARVSELTKREVLRSFGESSQSSCAVCAASSVISNRTDHTYQAEAPKCMSFVPAPQQANAAGANRNAPALTSTQAAAAAKEAAAAAEAAETPDAEFMFKLRTFDVYWVDKAALMYKDGIAKVRRFFWN